MAFIRAAGKSRRIYEAVATLVRSFIGLIGLLIPALLIGWLGLRALRRY